MFLLPKGNPLFENLAATKLRLPEVTSKLNASGFTGYASFVFNTATIILVFESGKLVSTFLEEKNGNRLTGLEAMSALTELMVASDSGSLNVFRLSRDLTMCIHALLQGEILYRAQELKLIDIKSLLEKIRTEQLNGCLRIYTEERSAMIFYKEGAPLGFFHDGSQDIETSSSESQKIASLPGAKIDLFSTQGVEELMSMDLLEVVNIQKLWDSSMSAHQSELTRLDQKRAEREQKEANLKLAILEEQVKTIVVEYVGKVGRGIVDKELNDLGGNEAFRKDDQVARLLVAIERSARLLISTTAIKQMLEKLSAAIATAKSEI
ncbi:GTPase-activating protein [Pelotalea chapellei]|uniref:GTPase-activating protein n=1 Tax=Pelotalea chapellei TaxID=44671 RepID=A0ABS5UDK1_9BACT|nr:GTPase-activating protein [Pelotalea chapellei]MBT1073546.1 GTPase-activating protein [Pelotalea chapellei]